MERHVHAPDVLGRVDKMVQAGRITEEDAARLRAAADERELEEAIGEIRARHAKARVQSAVDAGRLTQEKADAILRRLDSGEDPQFVLALRLGARSPQEGGGAAGGTSS